MRRLPLPPAVAIDVADGVLGRRRRRDPAVVRGGGGSVIIVVFYPPRFKFVLSLLYLNIRWGSRSLLWVILSGATEIAQRKMVTTQDRLKFKFFLSLNSNIGD